jgi:Tfp pilus assembly PilM family ATPase
VPMPPAEAVFEYSIVSEDFIRGETTLAISVLAAKTINTHTNTLLSGSLVPVSFETEARALARSLFPPKTKEVSLVLAIQANHSLVFITEKGAVVFSSSIDIGARDINKAIAKTLQSAPGVSSFDASLPVFSSLHDEIGKVLVFWRAQEKKIKDFTDVSRIILVGSSVLTPSFNRYISISFKLPTEVGSVWTNLESPEENLPELSRADSLEYGAVIGALIK